MNKLSMCYFWSDGNLSKGVTINLGFNGFSLAALRASTTRDWPRESLKHKMSKEVSSSLREIGWMLAWPCC